MSEKPTIKKGPKQRTKTNYIPPIRVSEQERKELDACAKLNCESISEYMRRAILERNQRIIKDWAVRNKFLEEVGETMVNEIE
jgi:uncharacterized protein (DUF1778 family)